MRLTRSQSVALAIFVILVAWEAFVRLAKIPHFLLPTPSAIGYEILESPGWYMHHGLFTLQSCLLGFGIALICGIFISIGILYSRFLENTFYTLLVSLNSIPKIALAPLFIIWLGTGLVSKVAISALVALFPIVIDTVLGLKSVDPDVIDLARSFKASRTRVLFAIRFPNALPAMFAGMKVAISLALVGAIAGEFVASENGLGYVILVAQGLFQTTRVFAAIMLLGVMGTILFYIVDLLERLLVPWHVSHRANELGTAERY